jgi:hypothetical protein
VRDRTRIDTATLGRHRFTVTGTSSDGQRATSAVTYTVGPSNQITVSHIKTNANGTVSFQVKIPGPGQLDVLETAWAASHRLAFGRAHATVTRGGVLHEQVSVNAQGKRLLHHQRYAVVLSLSVTYTPTGGTQRRVSLYGLHLGGGGTAAVRPIVSGVKGKSKAGRCTVARHPSTILTIGATLIYGVTLPPNAAGDDTVYYACSSPQGRAVRLGTDSPDCCGEYGPVGTTNGFAIAGDFAAAHVSYGEANAVECSKNQDSPVGCPDPSAWIAVVNVRTLRHATVSVPYTETEDQAGLTLQDEVPLAISPGGGIAWLQPDSVAPGTPPGVGPAASENWATAGDQLWATKLVPQGPSGFSSSPVMIDSGNIPASSIRFVNASTLTWSNGGTVHEQSIG